MGQNRTHLWWATLIGLFLLFLASALQAEGTDLIITSGTDATGDASYDDAWVDSTYWMNGWDIWIDGDLTINATGSLDANASASLTVNGTTTVSGTLDCGSATMSLGSGITSAYSLSIESGGLFDGGTSTCTIGSIYAKPGSKLYYSSEDTTITSYYSVSTVSLYIATNDNNPMGGNVIIDRTFGASQETRVFSGGSNVVINFHDLYINDTHDFETYYTSSSYCQLQIDHLIVNDQMSVYEVSGNNALHYINTNGTTVNSGTLDLSRGSDDYSFGWLDTGSGSTILSSGKTTITSRRTAHRCRDGVLNTHRNRKRLRFHNRCKCRGEAEHRHDDRRGSHA